MEDFKKFDLGPLSKKVTKKDLHDTPAKYDDVVPIWVWLLINIVTSAITIFPFGGIIVIVILFVIAFADFNQNLQNYARASLIAMGISLVLMLIFAQDLVKQIFEYLISGVF